MPYIPKKVPCLCNKGPSTLRINIPGLKKLHIVGGSTINLDRLESASHHAYEINKGLSALEKGGAITFCTNSLIKDNRTLLDPAQKSFNEKLDILVKEKKKVDVQEGKIKCNVKNRL